MLTKTKKLILLTLIVTSVAIGFFIFRSTAVFAQASLDFPTSFAGFSSQDLKTTIENIVRIVLGFIGFIFLLLLLYAGFVWMTSGGDEKKITRAKKIIASSVIGLLLTLSAYAIASFIVQRLTGAAENGSVGSSSTGPGGFGYALGSGALESHYPGRNARDIPRNTNIYITFKEAMDVKTICDPGPDGTYGTPDDPNRVNTASIQLKDMNSLEPADSNDTANDDTLEGITCQPTDASLKTFKFDPTANLGTGTGNVPYNVILVPHQIKTADNEDALAFGYSWRFTVNSVLDETPPKIISVYPNMGDIVPRNSIVQINFSEPVDPTNAAGFYSPTSTPASLYNSITLDDQPAPKPANAYYLAGTYASANQYQSTEFISNELCGQNSCGEKVYCLPGLITIYGEVTSAITDMAGNHLDGEFPAPYTFPSGDGTAGGNFDWRFQTTNTLDLKPPLMLTRNPGRNATDVDVYKPITMDFNKKLSASSLTSTNVGFYRTYPYPGGTAWDDQINYWVSKDDTKNLDTDPETETQVIIGHDIFKPLTPYHPGASSEIRDVSQNCYFPAQCDAPPYDGVGSLAECN